jgi:hypothetical protein
VFLVRWFLGMTFAWVNLGYYFIGVVLIAFADGATRSAKRAATGIPKFTLVKHMSNQVLLQTGHANHGSP